MLYRQRRLQCVFFPVYQLYFIYLLFLLLIRFYLYNNSGLSRWVDIYSIMFIFIWQLYCFCLGAITTNILNSINYVINCPLLFNCEPTSFRVILALISIRVRTLHCDITYKRELVINMRVFSTSTHALVFCISSNFHSYFILTSLVSS